MLKQYQPSIVHLNPSLDLKSFLRDGLFIFLAKLSRRPVLVFFRGWQTSFESQVSGKFKSFFSVTYGRADAFIVLANAFSDSLRRWGVTAPIFVGSTTVDNDLLTNFSIEKKVEGIRDTKVFRLLYLARLEQGKGALELVQAVRKLLDKGVPVLLTIAGDGPVVDELRALIGEFGQHQNAVRLVGYVRGDEKVRMFRSHHVFCFPTRYGEGMPNAVLEAMAFGLPVVTCPVGGIADFFEDGKMGVLLPNADPQVIAGVLQSVLSKRAQLEEIARYNHSFAQGRFLASSSAEFLRRCYRNMLAPK